MSYLRLINGLYLITLIVVSSPVHPPQQLCTLFSWFLENPGEMDILVTKWFLNIYLLLQNPFTGTEMFLELH